MLDVRKLRVLVAFDRDGSIAAAAESLSYTPSAVSQQLSTLERDAGVPLFRRAGRRLQLTDAGAALVVHGSEVLEALERAETELTARAGEVRGTLRVAAFQTAALALMVPALAVLRDRHPELRVEHVGMEAEQALPLVRSGRLDAAIAEEYEHAPRPVDPRLERIDLPSDELLVVLPGAHPAAHGDGPVPLAALADLPWATADRGTAYAEVVTRLCRTVGGFEPDVPYRDNDARVLLALAAEGHAATVLPALARPGLDERVAARSIADGPFTRRVFMAVRASDRGRPALEALAGVLAASGAG